MREKTPPTQLATACMLSDTPSSSSSSGSSHSCLSSDGSSLSAEGLPATKKSTNNVGLVLKGSYGCTSASPARVRLQFPAVLHNDDDDDDGGRNSVEKPSKPRFGLSFLKGLRRGPYWLSNQTKKNSKLLQDSMDADQSLLLHKPSNTGSWGSVDEKVREMPKKELRFAAKIAAAMDADGFIGVKHHVGTDDCKNSQYCVPAGAHQKSGERAGRKGMRRRWKFFRRMRRTRVLFACMLKKVKKAFSSSVMSSKVRSDLIK